MDQQQSQSQSEIESEVDIRNFKKTLDYIAKEDLIRKCDFIGFDLELTGIKPDFQDKFEDIPVERYLKMRKVAQKYTIIQFGLCFVVKEKDQYVGYPFTFYIFPQEQGYDIQLIQLIREDCNVQLQIGAVQYNTKHGMDWNRWIQYGIGYVNEISEFKQKEELLASLSKNGKQKDAITQNEDSYKYIHSKLTEEERQKLDPIIEQVDKFMKIEEEKTLHIPLTNAYQKRYVYCYVGFKYPELFIQKNQDTTFTLEKLLEEQWKKVEIVQKSEKEEKYDKLVAFTKLWKELCQTEKTFIGHNCWADILFIYTHLIGQLPLEYELFKAHIQKRLKKIYDTKLMISNCKSLQNVCLAVQTSTLEEIYKYFKQQNQSKAVQLKWAHSNGNQDAYHNAGYDAFITAYVFLNFKNLMDAQEYKYFENKVNLYRSYNFVNFNGQDIFCEQIQLLYIMTPPVQEEKNYKDKQNNFQTLVVPIEKALAQFLKRQEVSLKPLYNKYVLIEIRTKDDSTELFHQIVDQINQFCQSQKGYKTIDHQTYCIERREVREKEAKLERYDKKS